MSEKWNEYLLNDNTRVRLKNTIAGITKVRHLFTKWGSNLQCKD